MVVRFGVWRYEYTQRNWLCSSASMQGECEAHVYLSDTRPHSTLIALIVQSW